MKQKFSLAFFFGLSFFVASYFLSSVSFVSAEAGTTCTGSNGYKGTCITANGDCSPTTRTKSASSDCGSTADFTCCTNEPPSAGGGSSPSTGGTISGSVAPTSGACYDEFGGTIPCTYDPQTGKPLNGSNPSNGGVVSPVPAVTGTPPVGGGGGTATNSNRPPVTTANGTAKGLYIPTRAETGLSDVKVSALIQNLMQWLLYIVGFVAIIAFVISGIQYLLAGASEEMAKKAKANMQYAIIGVVVALSALIIIRAVQSVLSGALTF